MRWNPTTTSFRTRATAWTILTLLCILGFIAFAVSGAHRGNVTHVSARRTAPTALSTRSETSRNGSSAPLFDPLSGVGEVIAQQWVADTEAAGLRESVAEVLAEEWAAASRVPAPNPSGPTGSTVGECTGFVIPDYIIQRESGGNPNAWNSEGSGAYGCAQTLISHYSPGHSCAGLDPYTIDGQRECVYILSDGGRNLQPWSTR